MFGNHPRSVPSRSRRHLGSITVTALRAAIALGMALAAAAALADEPDAAAWQHLQAQIEGQVDAEIVAGPNEGRGGLSDIHGLVRTGTIAGDFSDLPPQDAPFGPEFGYSLAQQDDWLVVGAPRAVTTFAGVPSDRGALFVFRREGGAWIQKQVLTRPGVDAPRCGHSVALRLPHLITGCPDHRNTDGPRRGVIHQWKLQGNNNFLYQSSRFLDNDEAKCGYALAMSRNYFAVSCPNANNDIGRAYIFKRNTVADDFSGEPEAMLTGSAVAGMDTFQFGAALALYEPASPGLPPFNVRLAIGSPNTIYPGSIFPRGSMHLYHRALDQPTWSANATFTLSPSGADGNALASFGAALAMNRDQLVVGAPNNRFGALQTLPGPGSVHRFEFTNIVGTVYQWQAREAATGVNVPSGPHGAMRFGESVALGHDNLIAIGAPATDGSTNTGTLAEDVGLAELRRTANGDWSVANYAGELRPAPLSTIVRPQGRFGQSIDFDANRRRVAVGYPRSGTTLVGPGLPDRPRGAVWIYETDRIFADGFQ